MQKKILPITIGFIVIIAMSSWVNDILSSGAPIGSTGAPNERTCGQVGCHTGDNGADNINTGKGILTLKSKQDLKNIIPGEIYDLTITLTEDEIDRFGFSLTVLDESEKSVGQLIVTETQRTQILEGIEMFTNREYITYRNLGTYAEEMGKGEWSFQWKAPETIQGEVTFYLAGVSADGDGTDQGDLVYTLSKKNSDESLLSARSLSSEKISIVISPNPANEYINIKFEHQNSGPWSIVLFDIQGKKVLEHQNSDLLSQGNTYYIPIHELESGNYLVHIKGNDFSKVEKVIITH